MSGLASSGQLSSRPATAFRFGQPKAGIGRLVIEMNAPASPERVFALPPREVGGHRLVIDLIDKGLTRFKLTQKSLEANGYVVIQSNQAQAINTAAKPAALPQPITQQAKSCQPVYSPPFNKRQEMDCCY